LAHFESKNIITSCKDVTKNIFLVLARPAETHSNNERTHSKYKKIGLRSKRPASKTK
jgi:hypothetical protein